MRTFLTIILMAGTLWANAQSDSLFDGFSWGQKADVLYTHYGVDDSTLNRGMLADPLDALRAQLPGLLISRNGNDPNQPAQMRLRGLGSIISPMSPLVVVNGLPGVPLQSVDPDDISHVELLSGGEALARYGAQGAGGALIIETYQPSGTDRLNSRYRGTFSLDRINDLWPTLSAGEFLALDLGEDFADETDWQDEITRVGFGQSHTLSVNQTTNYGMGYYIGWHFRQARGVLRDQGYTQIGGRIGFNQTLFGDRLKINVDVNVQNRDAELGQPEIIRYTTSRNPSAPVFSNLPQFDQFDGYFQDVIFGSVNPVWQQDWGLRQLQSGYLSGQMKLQYEWLPGLVTEGRLGFQQVNAELASFAPLITSPAFAAADFQDSDYSASFTQVLTHYRKKTQQLAFHLTAGIQRQTAETTVDGIGGGIEVPSSLPVDIPTTEQGIRASNDQFVEATNQAFDEDVTSAFAFFNGNLREILYLSASLRWDNSLYRSQLNPGGSAAFRFDGLGKLSDKGLELGRVRLSYGQGSYLVGNLSVLPYATPFQLGEAFSSAVPDGTDPTFGLNPEFVRSTDIGLDLIGKKFSFQLTYYQRNTLNPWVNSSFGFSSSQVASLVPVANLSILNRGLELRAGWRNRGEKIQYSGFLQLATFQNELSLREGIEGTFTLPEQWEVFFVNGSPGTPGFGNTPMVRLGDGGSLGELNGPRLDVEATQLMGDAVFIDLNGEDFGPGEEPLGNGMPNWTMGVYQQLSLGNLTISGLIRGDFGHQLVNLSRLHYETQIPRGVNALEFEGFRPLPGFPIWSDHVVENGSYLTLDNLSLQYVFTLGQKRRLLFGLTARNLFTISNYSGLDPSPRLADLGILSDEYRAETSRQYQYNLIGLDRRSGVYPTRSLVVSLGLDI